MTAESVTWLRIEGMTGAGCADRVESILLGVPSVKAARVCATSAVACLEVSHPVPAEVLTGALRAGGYAGSCLRPVSGATAIDVDAATCRRRERECRQAVIQALFMWALPVIGLEWLGPLLASADPGSGVWWRALQAILCALALYSPAGGPLVAGGIRGVVFRQSGAEVLPTVALVAALLVSVCSIFVPRGDAYFFTLIVTVLGAVNVGRWIEALMVARRARDAATPVDEALLIRVHRAQARPTVIEGRAAATADIATLVVLALAAATGLGCGAGQVGFERALAVVIVAAPAAWTATAGVLFAALRDLARAGVVCSSADDLVALARVETVIFLRATAPAGLVERVHGADDAARLFARLQVRPLMVVDRADEAVRAVARRAGFDDVLEADAVAQHASRGRVALVGVGAEEVYRALRLGALPDAATGEPDPNVATVDGDLVRLPAVVPIARRAARILAQMQAWAWLYNIAVLPLAVAGVVTPWLAPVLLALSGVAQAANAGVPRSSDRTQV